MDSEELRRFIVESNNHTYSTGDESLFTKESNGSTTIQYERGQWHLHDNFFGGEPYGGREVVFFNKKPVWMMVYYGLVIESIDSSKVYSILQEALRHMPPEFPFRGPKEYKKEIVTYRNKWTGNLHKFKGEEKIYKDQKKIYWAMYGGGIIDRKR